MTGRYTAYRTIPQRLLFCEACMRNRQWSTWSKLPKVETRTYVLQVSLAEAGIASLVFASKFALRVRDTAAIVRHRVQQ